ncbi:tumor necrosis factor receptor superfamily member 5-like isoform X2 [Leuresthes tenuis]|uniref:tumor necrosis factor receptor superfamily member 5-like isoform X2 n=1 Tax=Leuresthes tenuis TaxID=355514 RepID=UPI003B50C16D
MSLQLISSQISVRWCLQLKKTLYLHHKMTLRGKPLTAASVLMILMRAFTVHTLTCHPSEYNIGGECCPMCPPGSRVKTDCTEFRSTSCLPCIDGTFMDKPNGLKHCVPCTTCDSGLKVKQSCTPTLDTVCETMEGFFCVDSTKSGCAEAQKHKSCNPGQYISRRGTTSTDTECSDCSSGTFSDGTLTSCQPHTQCESENLQLTKAGTSSSDAECGEKSSNVTAIVVGVLAGFFLSLVVTALLVYFLYHKKKICSNKDKQESPQIQHHVRTPTEDESLQILSVNPEGEEEEKENLSRNLAAADREQGEWM